MSKKLSEKTSAYAQELFQKISLALLFSTITYSSAFLLQKPINKTSWKITYQEVRRSKEVFSHLPEDINLTIKTVEYHPLHQSSPSLQKRLHFRLSLHV